MKSSAKVSLVFISVSMAAMFSAYISLAVQAEPGYPSGSSVLVWDHDEIGLFSGCSYYELRDFDKLSGLDPGTLAVESRKRVTGDVLGGSWEWAYEEVGEKTVPGDIVAYEVDVCVPDNETKEEVCSKEIRYKQTYEKVPVKKTVWLGFDDYSAKYTEDSVRNAEVQIVRFCAGIERES